MLQNVQCFYIICQQWSADYMKLVIAQIDAVPRRKISTLQGLLQQHNTPENTAMQVESRRKIIFIVPLHYD